MSPVRPHSHTYMHAHATILAPSCWVLCGHAQKLFLTGMTPFSPVHMVMCARKQMEEIDALFSVSFFFVCVDETFDSQSDSCFQRRHLLFLKFKNTQKMQTVHIFNCKSGPCLCKRLRHNVRVVVRAFRVSFAVLLLWLPCIYVNMCVYVWFFCKFFFYFMQNYFIYAYLKSNVF